MKVTKFGAGMETFGSLRTWADALGCSHEAVRDIMRNKELDAAVKIKVRAIQSIALTFTNKTLGR